MRWIAPLAQMALGLAATVLGFDSGRVIDLALGIGLPAKPLVVLGLPLLVGLAGIALFGLGVWRTWTLVDQPPPPDDWAEALRSVAEEYGAQLRPDPDGGVSLSTVSDNSKLVVVIQPPPSGLVSLWFGRPGLQALLVTAVRDGVRPEGRHTDGRWRLVGGGGTWELRAETPQPARGLLRDVHFVEDLNRLMAWPMVQAVRHDHEGVEVLAALPEPERLGGLVRSCLLTARSMARVNS